MTYQAKVGSDSPIALPSEDAFGYAPFARNLANAIRNTPSPNGLVMAVNGPWGSGKSSLLNLVKHQLKTVHESESPIIIEFNPWWFNDRHQLASQLLAQFSLRLISKQSEALQKIGGLLAEYSGSLSKAVALSTGVPYVDAPVNFFLRLLKRKPKEVPELKAQIAQLLKASPKRILFIIDDLDRLTPDEIPEVFKVVKALADFPNVIYLLSFDKAVVADALSRSLGVAGDAYMEKIVQASFSLPAIDRLRLHQKLFSDLDAIFKVLPPSQFDDTYWANAFHESLEGYIGKPRDIVRFINSFCVTYPPVAGEVNAVDFIALEFLRVFQDDVYSHIRENKERFSGVPRTSSSLEDDTKEFHESWLALLPAGKRGRVSSLMQRLFPKVESALGNMHYEADAVAAWRRSSRVCVPEIFDLYFQFSVPDDYLSQAEVRRLLESAGDTQVLAALLKQAKSTTRPQGHSKARDIVDRLTQATDADLSPQQAEHVLRGIFALGEDLLAPEDERGGMLRTSNWWRTAFLLNTLLDAVPAERRSELLLELIADSTSYLAMVDTVQRLEHSRSDSKVRRPWMESIDEQTTEELRAAVVRELEKSSPDTILASTGGGRILRVWSQWTTPESVRAKVTPMLEDNGLLLKLLEAYVTRGSTQSWGDKVSRTTYHFDPTDLNGLVDLDVLATRAESLLPSLPEGTMARNAAKSFLRGMARLRAGKPTDPGSDFRDSDDE